MAFNWFCFELIHFDYLLLSWWSRCQSACTTNIHFFFVFHIVIASIQKYAYLLLHLCWHIFLIGQTGNNACNAYRYSGLKSLTEKALLGGVYKSKLKRSLGVNCGETDLTHIDLFDCICCCLGAHRTYKNRVMWGTIIPARNYNKLFLLILLYSPDLFKYMVYNK